MRILLRTLSIALLGLVAVAVLLTGPLDGSAVERAPLPPGVAGETASRIMPSVVDVRAQGGGVERGRVAIGTGVIVDQGGLIVTNDHVITGESDQAAAMIDVTLHDGRRLEAALIGRDPDLDLALLYVDATALRPARFVTATDGIIGEAVVAVGAPDLLPRTVSAGRVTAVREDMNIPGRPALTTVLETSACLRPGYSGGPTVDRSGRVVGISFAGTTGDGPGCRGFAIPSATVLTVVDHLAGVAHQTAGVGGAVEPAPALWQVVLRLGSVPAPVVMAPVSAFPRPDFATP